MPNTARPSKASPLPAPTVAEIKRTIRSQGLALGFDKVGFAPAHIPKESPHLAEWLERHYQGEMKWMAKEPSRRTDAGRSLSRAGTVVCCAFNYYQGPAPDPSPLKGVISTYARGEDYHTVVGKKLELLADFVRQQYGLECKTYVDTGPLLEKSYAAAAGLGWLGKHSNLLSQTGSSWFFLGEVLLPVDLPPDEPERNHCGTCTRCITACPSAAIVEPYVVDSRLCISYLTIELPGFIPRDLRHLMGLRIYGCDDCQDVCPWNRFARKCEEAAFFPREPLASMDLVAMLRLTLEQYLTATKGSAIRRARYAGFLRNIAVALGNSGDPRALPALCEALDHSESLVRGHAAWALGKLGKNEAIQPLRERLNLEDEAAVREEIGWALSQLTGLAT